MAEVEQDASQLDLFAGAVELRRPYPRRNKTRFYLMVLQPGLFGGVDLVREWGRIGSPGRVFLSQHEDPGRARDPLAGHFRARRRR